MPFYEYQCKDCRTLFEQFVPISEADKKQLCPKCKSKKTEKLLSTFSAKSSSSEAVSGGGFT
ncbi:MAG TPA: zinc ribbon domain-containing protein [Smithellaceae bacterium]|jgi:putative FmdB family regulatory protein|nr:zinc ribbon domain-containing protein [Alphaproteobacteria bacterium]HPK53890.1 zinc ribbon domain-containing protein [Smithellaceae bacterium]